MESRGTVPALLLILAPAWAQDVREGLPEKTSRSYAALLQGLKSKSLPDIRAAQAKLRPLTEHLDKRYGGSLGAAAGKEGLTLEQAELWTFTQIFQSLSLCFDEAEERLGTEEEVTRRMRYALEEFAEVEPLIKAQGDLGFQKGRDIRRSIQRAMFLLKDRQKFSDNGHGVKAAFAAVYPQAVAFSLRGSLRLSLKDPKYRAVAQSQWKLVEPALKAAAPDKLGVLEAALKGDEKAVAAGVAALEAVYPSIRGLD